MKKLFITAAVILSVTVSPVLAEHRSNNHHHHKHKNNNDEGWYVLGGVVGGLLLGEAINRNEYHERPRRKQHVCRTEWNVVWDPYYYEYINVPRQICWYR
jgi:hypothetical protein